MTKYDSAIDRDANRLSILSNEAFKLSSSWTFAASTTGAVGAHTLFTVTGDVWVNVFATCQSSLTSGGAATIEVGVTGLTQGILQQAAATSFDTDMVWTDQGFDEGLSTTRIGNIIANGQDIKLTIGTTTVTGGQATFYCLWRPLSSNANITVTTPA